jgi:hypothetical protein
MADHNSSVPAGIASRTQIVRELQSICTEARRRGDRATWEEALRMWQARATPTEMRKAPRSISDPWGG